MFFSGVFGLVMGAVTSLADLAGVPIATDFIGVVLATAFFLPYYAIIASAYLQLRDGQPNANRAEPEPVDASQTPEL